MNLLDEPVGRTLWAQSVPMAVGVVAMFLVSLIDTYWASKLGTDALAAMSFAFPVIGIVLNVSIGLMIGTSVAVSRLVGAHELVGARRLAMHSMLLALGIVVVVTVAGLLSQDLLFTALGAPADLLPTIDAYMRIWYISAVFLVVPMMLNGVLRAHGDALTARNVMVLSAVFNGILDPLFIFGWGPIPAWGLEGAAAASGVSRALTFVYALAVAMRMGTLAVHVPGASEFVASSRTILQVGVPAIITNVLGPVATAVLTAIVATHGAPAVAAYGIGARVEAILLIPAIALSSGLSPFVGQNWGAHLAGRVSRAFSLSVRFSLAWGLFAFVAMWWLAPMVAAAFSDDATVREDIVLYLRIVPLGYGAYSVMMMVSSAFNATDHASRATVLSVLRSLVLAVPLAWAGSRAFGLPGIFGSLAVSSVFAGLIGAGWMRRFLNAEAQPKRDRAQRLVDAEFLLRRTAEDQRPATQELVDTMIALEAVDLHRTRGDAVGFYADDQELGHIHPSGHLDLPLPLEVGDELVRRGMVSHHRMQDGGWYTHELDSVADAREALWLLRLAHALYECTRRGIEHPTTQEEMASLGLRDDMVEQLGACAARWRPTP